MQMRMGLTWSTSSSLRDIQPVILAPRVCELTAFFVVGTSLQPVGDGAKHYFISGNDAETFGTFKWTTGPEKGFPFYLQGNGTLRNMFS